MPRSVKQKKYASRWANEAASLAKTLTKRRHDHDNNTTTQRTVETDVNPLPVVDELTETQATQDNGSKSASNLTVIDTKDNKKKTRPVQRTSNVVSDDSSGDEWKPYSRRRKRHKKKHPSGRRTSASGSTTSSSLPSERDDRDPSTVEERKPSPHQITFTFSPCTPSTDNKGSDGRNTSEENATGVMTKGTASDDAKKSEVGITSSKRPYAVWSEFCAKLHRELEENRRQQDKLKAKLKYDAKKTYEMYVAKKESARKKENAQRRENGITKSDIRTGLPSTQSIPNEVKTASTHLDGSRRSAGVKQVTSQGRVHVQAPKRTATNLTTSAKQPALLSATLPMESITCSAKHPPVSMSVAAQPWTSKHRRRLVLQWLKTLQNPTQRTGKKKSVNSLTVPPGPRSTVPEPTPPQHKPNDCPSDKGPQSNKATQQLFLGADKATNKAPGDKLEGENVGISSHQNPSTQDPCVTTEKKIGDDVQSKGTISKETKPQHSVWSSDSESDSSSNNSKTMLEVITPQHSTTEGKGKDEKSPEVSTCPPFTHTSSVNTPVENPSSSSIHACDKDSDSPSTPKNN